MRLRQFPKARQFRLDLKQRQHAVADRLSDRVHGLDLGLARADRHHHVGARHQRVDGGLAGAVAVRDRMHVHAVGDDHALIAEFLAQHAGEDGARHRGRIDRVQCGIDDVGRHDRRRRGCRPGGDTERRELEAFQLRARLVHVRQVAVRIDVGVAVAGEVLDAAGHAFALAAFHPGQGKTSCKQWIGAERALGDDGVVRVVVQVQHRREVPVEAQRAHRARHRRADFARQLRIVGGAQRHRARRRRHPGRAHHGAAFLVEGDQGARTHGVDQGAGEAGQLKGVHHVLAEQAHAADLVAAQEGVGVGIELGAEQAHHHQLAGEVEIISHGEGVSWSW